MWCLLSAFSLKDSKNGPNYYLPPRTLQIYTSSDWTAELTGGCGRVTSTTRTSILPALRNDQFTAALYHLRGPPRLQSLCAAAKRSVQRAAQLLFGIWWAQSSSASLLVLLLFCFRLPLLLGVFCPARFCKTAFPSLP